jgi:hypothetical protein
MCSFVVSHFSIFAVAETDGLVSVLAIPTTASPSSVAATLISSLNWVFVILFALFGAGLGA